MDRRRFLMGAGGLGLAASGCATRPENATAAGTEDEDGPNIQSNDGVVIHDWTDDVMQGFPPPPEKQVTRENHEESQEKLRWAMQHWRELFPTQRVSRGGSPVVVLPRQHRDIMELKFDDTEGQATNVSRQVEALDMDAFIVLHRGTILCEEYFHGMTPGTPHVFTR